MKSGRLSTIALVGLVSAGALLVQGAFVSSWAGDDPLPLPRSWRPPIRREWPRELRVRLIDEVFKEIEWRLEQAWIDSTMMTGFGRCLKADLRPGDKPLRIVISLRRGGLTEAELRARAEEVAKNRKAIRRKLAEAEREGLRIDPELLPPEPEAAPSSVSLRIKETRRPLALLLISDEPVIWLIGREKGVRLTSIQLAGRARQSVHGARQTPVRDLSRPGGQEPGPDSSPLTALGPTGFWIPPRTSLYLEDALGGPPELIIARDDATTVTIGFGSEPVDPGTGFSAPGRVSLRSLSAEALERRWRTTFAGLKNQRVPFWRTKTTDSGRTLLVQPASPVGPMADKTTTHAIPEDAGEPIALIESPDGLTLLCRSQLLTISGESMKAAPLPKSDSETAQVPFGLARDPDSGAILLGFHSSPEALDPRPTLFMQESPTDAWKPWQTKAQGTQVRLKPGEIALGLDWRGKNKEDAGTAKDATKAKPARAGPLLLTTAGIRGLSAKAGMGDLTAWPPGLGLQEGDRIQAHMRQGKLWIIADRLGLQDGNNRDRSLWVVEPGTGKRLFAAQW